MTVCLVRRLLPAILRRDYCRGRTVERWGHPAGLRVVGGRNLLRVLAPAEIQQTAGIYFY